MLVRCAAVQLLYSWSASLFSHLQNSAFFMTWLNSFQVEKARHVLLLREKLVEQNKTQELSKLDKEITNMTMKAKVEQTKVLENKGKLDESISEKEDDTSEKNKFALKRDNSYFNFQTNGEREKELAAKCLRLILQGRLPPSPLTLKVC